MQCEECGAVSDSGADVCAECGAPVKSSAGAAASLVSDRVEDSPREGTGSAPAAAPRPARSRLVLVAAAIAVLLIAAGGYFVWQGLSGANTPGAAAVRMLNGLASYDAKAILDNAAHSSLTATAQAEFAQQAADAKKGNKGLIAVKNVAVVKVTIDPKDPNVATVDLSGLWLTETSKPTYTARTETLTLVRENGTWLVRLFP